MSLLGGGDSGWGQPPSSSSPKPQGSWAQAVCGPNPSQGHVSRSNCDKRTSLDTLLAADNWGQTVRIRAPAIASQCDRSERRAVVFLFSSSSWASIAAPALRTQTPVLPYSLIRSLSLFLFLSFSLSPLSRSCFSPQSLPLTRGYFLTLFDGDCDHLATLVLTSSLLSLSFSSFSLSLSPSSCFFVSSPFHSYLASSLYLLAPGNVHLQSPFPSPSTQPSWLRFLTLWKPFIWPWTGDKPGKVLGSPSVPPGVEC